MVRLSGVLKYGVGVPCEFATAPAGGNPEARFAKCQSGIAELSIAREHDLTSL